MHAPCARCCRGGGWDMVSLAAFVFLRARYTSPAAVAHTWLPWAVLVALGVSLPLGSLSWLDSRSCKLRHQCEVWRGR